MKGFSKHVAALLAVLLALACVAPAFALGASDYNEHDVQKLRAFFEQADANGVKNGDKLFDNYNANDPATWVGQAEQEIAQFEDIIKWNSSNRLFGFVCSNRGLVGKLDLAGCDGIDHIWCWGNYLTELDFSGCTSLRYVTAHRNNIDTLNFEGVQYLFKLQIRNNELTTLDALRNVEIINMNVSANKLTEIDLSGKTSLEGLDCSHNRLTSLRIPAECNALMGVVCRDNLLTELVVEDYSIDYILCSDNRFAELDLSNCTIGTFECTGSPLQALHFNSCGIEVELYSGGHGSIGAKTGTIGGYDFPEMPCVTVYAKSDEGYMLDAWYDENGSWAYFYNECEIYGEDLHEINLTAVFEPGEEPVPPDPGYEIWDGSIAEDFASGRGTEAEPYRISNGAELMLLSTLVGRDTDNLYFELANDIYLNNIEDYESWTEINGPARNWRPIGQNIGYFYNDPFRGTFDGKGHTVYGIYVSMENNTESYCGLFGYVIGGVIKNVKVDCSTIFPASKAALVVGYAEDSQIINCSANGRIKCRQGMDCGGVVGSGEKTLISNCRFYGSVDGWLCNRVGGVVGTCGGIDALVNGCVNYGTVTGEGYGAYGGVGGSVELIANCRNEGAVELTDAHYIGGVAGFACQAESCVNYGRVTGDNTSYIAGVIGRSEDGGIAQCVNHGEVQTVGSTDVGGVVGYLMGSVEDCYNTGSVSGDSAAGIACELYDSTVKRCYNVGVVTGALQSDAIVYNLGHIGSVIENCYYLTGSCASGSQSGAALTDAQLRSSASYEGFDFNNVWTMQGDADYPYAELISICSAAVPGDINGDGAVNANDALLVLRSALGLTPPLGLDADVNGDGAVNANDALLILRAALGLSEL